MIIMYLDPEGKGYSPAWYWNPAKHVSPRPPTEPLLAKSGWPGSTASESNEMGVPKIRGVPFLEIPTMRILEFWGLYRCPLFSETTKSPRGSIQVQ